VSPFAGRHPRGISAGATSCEGLQTSRRVEPVTRVLEALREGHAPIRPRTRARLCSGASAHGLSRPRKWNAACEEPSRTERGSQVPGAATHHGDRRNRHRLVPASSGAKAPLACEGRTLVGCARASIYGCRSRQASPRLREARLPLATGRVDGSLALDGSKGSAGVKRRLSSAWRRPSHHGDEVRSRALERALRGDGPCSMEDTSGHCGSAPRSRGCEAGDLGGLHGGACPRERRDQREGGDRGVRGSVCTRHGGKTTPTATAPEGERATHRSESS